MRRRRSSSRVATPTASIACRRRLAVIVAGLAYALLPASLLFEPRYVIPAIELALLVALVATNPRRMTRETRWSRIASIALASIVIVTNMVSLGLLVHSLTDKGASGMPLLLGAMQVWLTNVIGFALLFWELDRGGPVARRVKTHPRCPAADWRFSQDENHDAVARGRGDAPARSPAGSRRSSTTSTSR